MSTELKLIIFDVDGTLVDSQDHILAAMTAACASVEVAPPSREAVLSIVGLSLPEAVLRLMPDSALSQREKMVDAYKGAFNAQREELGAQSGSPFYDGALDVLRALQTVDHHILGIATGKSRRGLDSLLSGNGLEKMFFTQQVADDHPSKPHPSMIFQALSESGVDAANAVMIGDTSFDMAMAKSAGVGRIGVDWGYHSQVDLTEAGAEVILQGFDELTPYLDQIWSGK
ncbi:HAD-IA family hydrolase [Falsihalocynthiibacter sp. S25ZX9]|uniref:HAD-IA family hydrolase n=1 Tax=Falsihalocynthiibacter sp. S25ZX9 TaxID=3240870 RepID=UPI003510055A